jgi:hypothetical protein
MGYLLLILASLLLLASLLSVWTQTKLSEQYDQTSFHDTLETDLSGTLIQRNGVLSKALLGSDDLNVDLLKVWNAQLGENPSCPETEPPSQLKISRTLNICGWKNY